jgi:hypothetical protein
MVIDPFDGHLVLEFQPPEKKGAAHLGRARGAVPACAFSPRLASSVEKPTLPEIDVVQGKVEVPLEVQ